MTFRRAQPGDQLSIPAAAWNACLDAAEANIANQGQVAVVRGLRTGAADEVLIKNTTETDLDRFAVLGISGIMIDPADNEQAFKNQIALTGTTPTTADHLGKFAVLQEPCGAGKIARAKLDGLTVCKVDATDTDVFADVSDSDATMLKGASAGAACILWRQSGTGAQWAVVRLANKAAGGATVYEVYSVEADHLVCRLPSESGSDPVTYVAKPWSLRRSLDEGTTGTITVIYTNGKEKTVEDSAGYPDEVLRITPSYNNGTFPLAYILAMEVGDTGVTVDGEPVTLLDLNIDGRQWAEVLYGT